VCSILEDLGIDEFVERETWKNVSHLKGRETHYIQIQNKNILFEENNYMCTLVPVRP